MCVTDVFFHSGKNWIASQHDHFLSTKVVLGIFQGAFNDCTVVFFGMVCPSVKISLSHFFCLILVASISTKYELKRASVYE